MNVTSAAIVAEARGWVGTRWQHQAALKGKATDCIGLISGVASALGVPEAATWANDPRRKSYGKQPDPTILVPAADEYMLRVRGPMQIGDVLLMRFDNDPDPRHFAIVSGLSPTYIIHAYAAARRVVEHRVDEAWSKRIVSVYRFRGL